MYLNNYINLMKHHFLFKLKQMQTIQSLTIITKLLTNLML